MRMRLFALALGCLPLAAATSGELTDECLDREALLEVDYGHIEYSLTKVEEHFGIPRSSPRFPHIFLGVADAPDADEQSLPRWRDELRVAFVGPEADAAEAIVNGLLHGVTTLGEASFRHRIVDIDEANVIVHAGLAHLEEDQSDRMRSHVDRFFEAETSFATAWHDWWQALGASKERAGELDSLAELQATDVDERVSLRVGGGNCRSAVLVDGGRIKNAIISIDESHFLEEPRHEHRYMTAMSMCLWEGTAHALGTLGYGDAFTEAESHGLYFPVAMLISGVDYPRTFRHEYGYAYCGAFTSHGRRIMELLY